MINYLLAFTLDQLNGHYELLMSSLTDLGAKHEVANVWTVRARVNAEDDLRRRLALHIHACDDLIIRRLAE